MNYKYRSPHIYEGKTNAKNNYAIVTRPLFFRCPLFESGYTGYDGMCFIAINQLAHEMLLAMNMS
ncbi:hypothetical protein MASR2M36_11950 [Providencia sp.]